MNLQARELVLFKIKKCVYLLGFMVHTWRSHSVVIIFNQFICIGFKGFFPTTKSPQSQQTGSKNRFVNWMARCITGWPWILEDLSTGLNVRQIGPTFPVFWHHLVAVMWLSWNISGKDWVYYWLGLPVQWWWWQKSSSFLVQKKIGKEKLPSASLHPFSYPKIGPLSFSWFIPLCTQKIGTCICFHFENGA